MSNGPNWLSPVDDLPDSPERTGPDPSGEVELYWSRPSASVRRDVVHSPPAAGRHRLPVRSADPGSLAGLWIDLGGGD